MCVCGVTCAKWQKKPFPSSCARHISIECALGVWVSTQSFWRPPGVLGIERFCEGLGFTIKGVVKFGAIFNSGLLAKEFCFCLTSRNEDYDFSVVVTD